MHPWPTYEGIVSSIDIDYIEGGPIFYMAELGPQLDRLERMLFILMETLDDKGTWPELRQIYS